MKHLNTCRNWKSKIELEVENLLNISVSRSMVPNIQEYIELYGDPNYDIEWVRRFRILNYDASYCII